MSMTELVDVLWEIKGGRSLAEMARLAGLHRSTLWRIMHRRRYPSGDTLVALLRAFPQLGAFFASPDVPKSSEVLTIGNRRAGPG